MDLVATMYEDVVPAIGLAVAFFLPSIFAIKNRVSLRWVGFVNLICIGVALSGQIALAIILWLWALLASSPRRDGGALQ